MNPDERHSRHQRGSAVFAPLPQRREWVAPHRPSRSNIVVIESCPKCGERLETGYIEGHYLGWFRSRTKLGGILRTMSGGLGLSRSQRIGDGFWPSVLHAGRCRICGLGVFYED